MTKINSEYLRLKDELLRIVFKKELRKSIMNLSFTMEELQQIKAELLKKKSIKKPEKKEQLNLF